MRIHHFYIISFLCLFLWAEKSTAQCLSGTTISSTLGNDDIAICSATDVPERIYIEPSTFATRYAYLITDSENVIVQVSDSPLINLSTLEPGDYRIWGLSYGGVLSAAPGVDLDTDPLSDFCYELSDNFLTLSRGLVSGGTVQTTAGETEVVACVGDGAADVFEFENTGSSSENYAYVVTDENNSILTISQDGSIDFEGADAGICRVWGLAYTGELTANAGENAAEAMLAEGCFELSSNFVTVTRNAINGGMVMMPNGATERLTCPSDGMPDIVRFDSTGVLGENFTYLITDDQNNILSVPTGDFADLDGAGPGASRIWGLAYTGNLTITVGENAAEAILSDECFDLSDNFILVVRVIPDAGTIATSDGSTAISLCANEGEDTPLTFSVSDNTVIPPLAYVLTDEENVIIELSTDNEINFDGRTGTFRVHALSYTGNVTATAGDDADEVALTDDCFDLSDNFVTVTVTNADGGTVVTENGATEVTVCVGDGEGDIVAFDSMDVAETANFTYVVTDENNVILAVPAGDQADFEDAEAGVCRVWGLSYTGTLIAEAGDNAAEVALSDECFDLSDNFITVNRQDIEAGTIALVDGSDAVTVCAGDETTDFVTFSVAGNTPDADFQLILTDTSNRILFFYNPNDTVLDLTGIIPAEYRMYSVSYTGTFTGETEINLADAVFSDQCFSLTENFVNISAIDLDGGAISTEEGTTEVAICAGDGSSDEISFETTSSSVGNYTFVVTDENNVILSLPAGSTIDFENAGAGICRVWGLAYTGDITAMVGDTANLVALSDGCFELSENFVTVDRTELDAGMVTTIDGQTDTTIIVDGVADELSFVSTADTAGVNFTYVVTDDNNVILALPEGNTVDFDPAGLGICRVWGLVYTGNITAMAGDTASAIALSDACFELSSNFVTVNRIEAPCLAEAGTLTAAADSVEFITDTITISAMPNGDQVVPDGYEQLFVLTTPDGGDLVIQAVSETPGFEVTAIGTYTIHTLIAELNDETDADFLDLSVVEFGVTTAVDVLNLVSDNDLCADLDAAGATVTVIPPAICLAEAGSLTATADTVTLEGDSTMISATPNGDRVVPAGYEFLFVLTSGENLVIEAVSETPNFIVDDPGLFTIHTLVAELSDDSDPNFLDISVVEFGMTTGADVINLLVQNELCADLDGVGAAVTVVEPEPCLAEAGTLTATPDSVALDGGVATISATPNGDLVVPNVYEFTYVLTSGNNLVIEAVSETPSFEVADTGMYTIHTLVAELSDENDPNFVDLSIVEFGVTTGGQVLSLIFQNGICADLDVAGAKITVVSEDICLADAGTLTADMAPVTLQGDSATISASPNGDRVVPNNYEVLFVLTSGSDLVIEAVNATPNFTVADTGLYTIHTLVAELSDDTSPNFVDLSVVEFGTTTGVDVVNLLLQNELCADLDAVGAPINVIPAPPVIDPAEVFLISGSTDTTICVDGAADKLTFGTTADTSVNFSYIVTDADNTVLQVLPGNMADFDPAGTGNCRTWGLSYFGDLTVSETIYSETFDQDSVGVSGDCPDSLLVNCDFYNLPPENDQWTISTEVDADSVFLNDEDYFLTLDGALEAQDVNGEFCFESRLINISGLEDLQFAVEISEIGDLEASDYVDVSLIIDGRETLITNFSGLGDSEHTLVGDIPDDEDFGSIFVTQNGINGTSLQIKICVQNNAASEQIRIDNVSVTDCTVCGQNATEATFADSTFVLSSNFVNIDRIATNGGMVSLTSGSTDTLVVVSDGVSDILEFTTTADMSTGNYTYLITDNDNNILIISETPMADFDGAGVGICRIWGLAYTGNLTASVTDNAAEIALSDECFSLSENFITVERVEEEEGCEADAGTITPAAGSVALSEGVAMLSGIPGEDAVVPENYEVIYVLTSGEELVIEDTNVEPEFIVNTEGTYTIHTLVAEVSDPMNGNFLDLSVIELGVTTGADVLELIADSGICADLDVEGASITVNAEATTCIANAGTITANETPVTLMGNGVTISATPDGNAEISSGFEVVYVLTSGPDLIIQDLNDIPSFVVTEPGDYRIHTFIGELDDTRSPDYFDISVVEFGVSTGIDVVTLLLASGVCADLDPVGAQITVEEAACLADAGTLTADADTVEIVSGLAFLSATTNGDQVVPDGYEQVYVLTRGTELTLIAPNVSMPSFSVMSPGLYTIHTLVAELSDQDNPNYLDLTNFMFGTSTGVDVATFIDTSGICADLDAVGAAIIVEEGSAGNLNDEVTTAQLTVGPNPASNQVQVTLDNDGAFMANENVRLQVYNMNGQLLKTLRIRVEDGLNQYELETAGLQSGLYLIRIEGEQSAVQEQFMKARF